MSTDVAVRHEHGGLMEQVHYARYAAEARMLPDAYRGKPADILIAIGLGQSMGLSPAESLYRISVIKGKPTASAELIAANVRKAGHKLRVRGDDTSCTAQIIRADDPEFPFEVTRDMAWAQQMGLARNDNYQRQPGTMLQWRAITAVARLACPEALYGVAYTPDEMYDLDGGRRPEQPAQRRTLAAAVAERTPTVDVSDAEEVEATVEPDPMTDSQRAVLTELWREVPAQRRTEILAGRDPKRLSREEADEILVAFSDAADTPALDVEVEA